MRPPAQASPVRPLGALLTVVLLLYPLLVFALWGTLPPWTLALAPLVLLLVRAAFAGRRGYAAGAIALAGVVAYAVLVTTMVDRAVFYYPVVVNLTLAATLAYTLVRPPSLIESLSRAMGMTMTAEGVVYTRGVTMLWTLFFAANAVVCWLIARYGTLATWGWYNGVVSHAAAGALFGFEYVFRCWYRRRVHGAHDPVA